MAVLAIGPRMPFDIPSKRTIGGRLSFPFRRALLALVLLGMTRVVVCHVLFPGWSTFDAILGTIHVAGQSFLCLTTTAYLLQIQLSNVINITPGSYLMPPLIAVSVLTISAFVLVQTTHPNVYCLGHVAEALSCCEVLRYRHCKPIIP